MSIILTEEACKRDLDDLVMQMNHEPEVPSQMMQESDKELIVVVQQTTLASDLPHECLQRALDMVFAEG